MVQNGTSGFTFDTISELQAHTSRIIKDEALRMEMAVRAHRRSLDFDAENFRHNMSSLFKKIENALTGGDVTIG